MAYDLALHYDEWDLAIENNDIILTEGAERIAQQILITLRFWYGEWFLDRTDGVPYLEQILVKNPNLNHIRQILSEKILSVNGVVSLDALNLDYNPRLRTLLVDYAATTNYGLVERQVSLSG